MKIRKAVLLLACAVSWGIAVWFAGRLWAAYPLVSVRSDVPVTGRQLEALRSALRQEDGASALVPAFWSQAEGSAESRWETCGITAILYCGEYDAVYPAVLLEGRFPAAQENGKCAVSTAAAWQLWGSEDVLGQELEIEGDIYRVCGLFRSSASLALCGESLDHGFSNIEFWGGYAAPPVETVQQLLRAAGIAQQVTLYFPFPWMAALTAYALKSEIDRYMQSGFNAYLTKPIAIEVFVNTRPELVHSRSLDFWAVARLAYPDADPANANIEYTITYAKGPRENRAGNLTPGQTVQIKGGMEFYVLLTDKS